MMKKRLLVTGVIAFLLLTPADFARAQEAPAAGEAAKQTRPGVEEKTRMLRGIRNEKKRAVVQRVGENIALMNGRLTERYSRMLVKIEEQLARISSRVDELANQEKDIQSARAATQKAREAINAAKNEVSVQAGKVYDFDFKDEATAKAGLDEARRKLRDDLAALREKLRQAHRATVESLVALKQLKK